jgi:GNAT superfamily N-acetyltransferase
MRQTGPVSAADLDIHVLRLAEQAAVRSLILAGLSEHWGTVDPALNRDLDHQASTYADGTVLVASDGPAVVGTGTIVRRDALSAEVVRMSVAAEYRRIGLGRRLVDAMIEIARGWGMKRIVLETTAEWTEVVEFYVRCGFTLTHFEAGTFGRDAWFEMNLDVAGPASLR